MVYSVPTPIHRHHSAEEDYSSNADHLRVNTTTTTTITTTTTTTTTTTHVLLLFIVVIDNK